MTQQQRKPMNNSVTVDSHDKLRSVKQTDFQKTAADVLREADRGHQTAVLANDGTISAIVGLNGHRFFQNPTPDPLDEILQIALDAGKEEKK